jgi:hypothetical protein
MTILHSSSLAPARARHLPWMVLASIAALFIAAFVITVEPSPPPGGWHVNVRWTPQVTESARRDLETKYGLKLLQQHAERTWVYRLGNASRANIRAFVGDAAVEDTHGIDRRAFTVAAPRVTLARRFADEHAEAAGALSSVASARNAVLIAFAAVLATALRDRRALAALSKGIPPLSAAGLGLYRAALGTALIAVVIKYDDLPGAPFPRELHRSYDWFADWGWVHALASRPDLEAWSTPLCIMLLAAFTIGAFARPAYLAFLVILTAHVLVVLQHKSAHDWGLPLVTLWGLAVVPWGDGAGITMSTPNSTTPNSQGARANDNGFAVWFPGLMLGLAFAAAAYAKFDSSGLDWITGGAVKYHFIEDSQQAPTTWGLWIASHDAAAVAFSTAAIVVEALFFLHVFLPSAWVRGAFGLAGLALLLGFGILQGVVWAQWWLLFLCFVPWEAIAKRRFRTRPAPASTLAPPLRGLPAAVMGALLIVQMFASAHRLEAEPFVSDYGMYSWTWPSRDAFDAQMRRKYRRYSYRQWQSGREGEDVTSRIHELPKAGDLFAEVIDVLRAGQRPDAARRRALAVASASYEQRYGKPLGELLVLVDEQAFDWTFGRFYVKSDHQPVGLVELSTATFSAAPRDLRHVSER